MSLDIQPTEAAKATSFTGIIVLQLFLIDKVELFSEPTFWPVSVNLDIKISVVRDVLSSHEHEIFRPFSLDQNYTGFEVQTDGNY